MPKKIKIAIVGVGNCAASLLMGLSYYKDILYKTITPGLMHPIIGEYKISDIEVVAAFDVDKRKIGKDLSDAIFQPPNCTKTFCKDITETGVKVNKGPVLDGVAPHMKDYFQVDETQIPIDVKEILNESKAEILINYLPVGSKLATEYYAQCALDANCAFINCIPIFIASNKEWGNKFKEKKIPIIGDDVKSQVGATILNRYLVQMIQDRGGKIDSTYQINVGGNTDFLNMTSQDRLYSKKISKTESISSLIPYESDNTKAYVYAGPNGFIEYLKDNKICHLRIDFKTFGDMQCSIDCKLSVEDSPNSAGCIIDAIRIGKVGLDKEIGGPLIGPSAWLMKHPPIQYPDNVALKMTEDFINYNKC